MTISRLTRKALGLRRYFFCSPTEKFLTNHPINMQKLKFSINNIPSGLKPISLYKIYIFIEQKYILILFFILVIVSYCSCFYNKKNFCIPPKVSLIMLDSNRIWYFYSHHILIKNKDLNPVSMANRKRWSCAFHDP